METGRCNRDTGRHAAIAQLNIARCPTQERSSPHGRRVWGMLTTLGIVYSLAVSQVRSSARHQSQHGAHAELYTCKCYRLRSTSSGLRSKPTSYLPAKLDVLLLHPQVVPYFSLVMAIIAAVGDLTAVRPCFSRSSCASQFLWTVAQRIWTTMLCSVPYCGKHSCIKES
jgi:hypothetical protein